MNTIAAAPAITTSTGKTLVTACEGCVFWDHPPGGVRVPGGEEKFSSWYQIAGYCRRNSPGPGSRANRAAWPTVAPSDWCGNGEPR